MSELKIQSPKGIVSRIAEEIIRGNDVMMDLDSWVYKERLVTVQSILDKIEHDITKGNMNTDFNRKGFSAGLWLSDFKKELEKNK